jgi:two-component system, response regulator
MILLVEDNPDDVDLTMRAFKKHNLANQIQIVRDGVEALAFLLGSEGNGPAGELPDLVLLDLKLPRVDGFEVLRRIRGEERTRLLPVVVLTSSAEEEDVVRSYRLGANSYVRKPVNFNEFVEAAKQLGLYWLVLNRPPPRTEGSKA